MQIITWHISIKNIFKNNWNSFVHEFSWLIRPTCYHHVNAILSCKDPTSWFATYKCDSCSDIKTIAFTCKSRFCNSCWKPQSDLRMHRLLSWRPPHLQYYHLAFTIPEELRAFFKRHRITLQILPQVASQAICYFFKTKHKSKPWILSVIHTFWAQLNRNPHVHLIITSWWINDQWRFVPISFIPYKLILPSRKKYLLKTLKERVYKNLENPDNEIKLLNSLFFQKNELDQEKSRYIYFSKKAQSFQVVLSYIWRYLKRPTISQSRILEYDWSSVTFQYKDKYDWQNKTVTCSVSDFIWLLIQHIPNKYFHMVYYKGIFANRCKAKYLEIINQFYTNNQKMPHIPTSFSERVFFFTWKNPFLCRCWWSYCLQSLTFPNWSIKYFDSS